MVQEHITPSMVVYFYQTLLVKGAWSYAADHTLSSVYLSLRYIERLYLRHVFGNAMPDVWKIVGCKKVNCIEMHFAFGL